MYQCSRLLMEGYAPCRRFSATPPCHEWRKRHSRSRQPSAASPYLPCTTYNAKNARLVSISGRVPRVLFFFSLYRRRCTKACCEMMRGGWTNIDNGRRHFRRACESESFMREYKRCPTLHRCRLRQLQGIGRDDPRSYSRSIRTST